MNLLAFRLATWDVHFAGIHPDATYENILFNETKLSSSTKNIYVYECYFEDFNGAYNGGGMFCAKTNAVLVEICTFVNCITAGKGGALCVKEAKGCALSRVCSFNCRCGSYATSRAGQFCFITNNTMTKFEQCSNLRSISDMEYLTGTIFLYDGSIDMTYENLTDNAIDSHPIFNIHQSKNMKVSYSTFKNNTALTSTCLHVEKDVKSISCKFEKCNIFNNKAPGAGQGILNFASHEDVIIKDSCLLNNVATYLIINANQKVTVDNTYMENEKVGANGDVSKINEPTPFSDAFENKEFKCKTRMPDPTNHLDNPMVDGMQYLAFVFFLIK